MAAHLSMTTETSNARGAHTCSYACERPECIRAQRDELASRVAAPPPAAARGDVRGLAEVIRQAVQTQFETTRPIFGAPRDRLLTGPNTISMAVHTAVEAFLAAEGVQAGEVEERQALANVPFGWVKDAPSGIRSTLDFTTLPGVAEGWRVEGYRVVTLYSLPYLRQQPAAHPDDAAVDAFAAAMKEKLAAARAKGRGGWNGDEPGMQKRLSDMLRAHVEKGDPRDVANFCMFLHQRGESILSQQPEARGVVDEAAVKRRAEEVLAALAPIGINESFASFAFRAIEAALTGERNG